MHSEAAHVSLRDDLKPQSPSVSETPAFARGVQQSFSGRAWRMRGFDAAEAHALEEAGLSAGLAQILAARGVTRSTSQDFLGPTLKSLMPDPFQLANMEKAASRIADAVMAGEQVAVLADYDVDGACSASLLMRYLRAQGLEPLLHVPDRMTEGYGPSVQAMRNFAGKGAKVVITVDCGAAAHEALQAARDLGVDVVVLDHHMVETHPPAYAHVNPNSPGDESGLTYICGAGVTFLALVALQRSLREKGWFESRAEFDLLSLLDVVGLATITDVVPLVGLNRAFVRQGLKRLDMLATPGLHALARVAGVEPPFTTYHLGFAFGPRINAGGRVGRCDLGALLLSTSDDAQADQWAQELDGYNRERQAVEAAILERAHDMAAAQSARPFILLAETGWHPGVVGIVAGRLKDRNAKPVLVAGFERDGDEEVARGSARSVAGIDLGHAVRSAREAGILETGGGHAMAAGFTVKRKNLAAFAAHLDKAFEPQRAIIAEASGLEVDAVLAGSAASIRFLDDMDRAGPYGAGNPEPMFVLADMMVAYADIVGSAHVKLRLAAPGGAMVNAIGFRLVGTLLGEALLKARGKPVHIAGRLKRDSYGGTERVQLHIEDAAQAWV